MKQRLAKLKQNCTKCESPIPEAKRSDAIYCSVRCRSSAEKLRYVRGHPKYVERQRRLVQEIRHMEVHGHTRYIDMPIGNMKDRYRVARSLGFRSGLEVSIARALEEAGVAFEYEKLKIKYEVNETRTYTPDYVFPNGIIIEGKGRFVSADRKKHLLVKKQYPALDIRFVFSNSRSKINKGSKTSYADWCVKHGFQYADKLIPVEWTKE